MKTLFKVLSIGLVGGLCCQAGTPKSVARQLHRSLQSHIILSIQSPLQSFSLSEDDLEKLQKLQALNDKTQDRIFDRFPGTAALSLTQFPSSGTVRSTVSRTVEHIIWENDE
ncbi:MAG: hypothetical protein MI784_01450 [Cytophagales bacterium]|nr:hypothetical protein [Cytophagales bacterium]